MIDRYVAAQWTRLLARRGSQFVGHFVVTVDPAASPQSTGSRSSRVLLVAGLDRDVGGQPVVGRADAILLVLLPVEHPTAQVVAIPRDLATETPVGLQRLGWMIEYGGMDLLARAVTGMTGLRIDHVVAVDLATLSRVVDALGGIDVDVPANSYDRRTGVRLRAGPQRLPGAVICAYVRSRLDESGAPGGVRMVLGDDGRRLRLQVVADALRSRWASAPWWRRLRTLSALRGRLLVDPAFPDEAVALARLISGRSLEFIDLQGVPLEPDDHRRSPFPPHHPTGSRYLALADTSRRDLDRLAALVG